MTLFLEIIFLIIGMILLIKGAELFVDGSKDIARRLHIPPLIIGLTLVSIGTSMPELSVSLTSAIKGLTDMSFGNVIGSNIFNTFVVIGVSAIFIPLTVDKYMLKYDIPILIVIYTILSIFSFLITPNVIDFYESLTLFIMMLGYIVFLILRVRHEKMIEDPTPLKKWWVSIILLVLGLGGIILGGSLVVDNSKNLAIALGMSELLVGLTIVAVGTSLPELVTSVVAAKKGENDIAIGNAIGSCIFNVVLILALSGMIEPTTLANSSLVDLMVMLSSAVLIILMVLGGKRLGRIKGIILVLIYIIYLAYIIIRNLGII